MQAPRRKSVDLVAVRPPTVSCPAPSMHSIVDRHRSGLWFRIREGVARPPSTSALTVPCPLLRNSRPRCRCRLLLRGRDYEGEPRVPAVRPMLGAELLVGLEVHIALKLGAERNDIADLRP